MPIYHQSVHALAKKTTRAFEQTQETLRVYLQSVKGVKHQAGAKAE
jgi:hypothetical protein